MTDRERVIFDIERCICHVPDACRDCSKYGRDNALRCMEDLLKDALELLKEQEENDSEWLEDSDPGQEYGTTWACRVCGHSLHMPYIWNPYEVNWKFCPWCGARMAVKMDD